MELFLYKKKKEKFVRVGDTGGRWNACCFTHFFIANLPPGRMESQQQVPLLLEGRQKRCRGLEDLQLNRIGGNVFRIIAAD